MARTAKSHREMKGRMSLKRETNYITWSDTPKVCKLCNDSALDLFDSCCVDCSLLLCFESLKKTKEEIRELLKFKANMFSVTKNVF